MTIPDPRNSNQPGGQPLGDEAAMGHEPAHGTPASGEEWLGGAQAAGGSGTHERKLATSSDASSAPQAETKRKRVRAKLPALQSFGDLLRTAYGGKRKRLKPKKAEIVAMRSASKLEPSELEELLALSASDRILERTRELMLLSMERFAAQVLAGQVREFVREVLRRHPAFLAESLAGVLENRPEALSEEGAVRMLTSQSFAALPWPEGLVALKKKDAEQCRANALCCLLLWFKETRATPFERIWRYLQTSIWAPVARDHKTDPRKLRALMSIRDPAGIAVACTVLEKQALEQGQLAAAARRAEERAAMRAKELEDELATVSVQFEAAKAEVGRLSEEIGSARLSHENERVLMCNDYEELRGRVLRRLREELSLLEEGLNALRRDPPKVHVMEDHAERAIDGLKREMEKIKGGD